MLNIEKLVTVLGWRGEVVGVGETRTEAGRCGRKTGRGCGNRQRLVLDGLKKCEEAVSGRRKKPNVSNLELQPVTYGRMREKVPFPSCSESTALRVV